MSKPLRVAVMGDICMADMQDRMTPEFAAGVLREVRPLLAQADLRIANLENAITAPDTPIDKCGPNLWMKPENLCFFREAGVDCAILANNHTGDFGPAAVENTANVLDKAGIGRVGAGQDLDAAYEPWFALTDAGTLAVCAWCENEFGGATMDAWGSAGFDWHRAAKAIRAAHEKADFVLVIMHGGNEHNPLPSPRVRARYRTFVDLGADAVIGMHPHCIQGHETYRDAPIAYSTGNFFFRGRPAYGPSWWCGYVAELTFEKGKKPALALHPYQEEPDLSCIRLLQGEKKEKMLAYIEKLSAIIPDERELRRFFDGWCTITGPAHAKYAFDEAYLDQHDFPTGHPMLALRNIRTCEAHDELVTNLFRMILEGRVEEGRKTAEEIRELQKMPI